jgi:ABC-2 type transport system permease protein
MNKTYLIFKHELLHTLKRPGFIILTFIVPIIALIAIGVGHLVSGAEKQDTMVKQYIGFVDETKRYNKDLAYGGMQIIRFNSKMDATNAMVNRKIPNYFVVTEEETEIAFFTLEKEIEIPPLTRGFIKSFINLNLLSDKVSQDTIQQINMPLQYTITRLNEEGNIDEEQSSYGSIIISSVFALLLGLALMIGSTYLLQGMGEEKESRLIEVLISSVSVRQLLMGKLLGLGTAGMAQVLVWLLSIPLLLSIVPPSVEMIISSIHFPAHFILLGIIYFVLGYTLFAVMSIGVGAISPNAREAQSISLLYTMFSFVPLWLLSLQMFFPDSPAWVVLSLFPLTAPVQVMFSLGTTDIPVWQLMTSIAIMIVSIVAVLFLTMRMFRAHLLKYGKRPSFREIRENLKNM